MDQYRCKNCGSNEVKIEDDIYRCQVCGSIFAIEKTISNNEINKSTDEIVKKNINKAVESNISVKSDVDALLEKIKKYPWMKERYIKLILEIDPTNSEVKKYL